MQSRFTVTNATVIIFFNNNTSLSVFILLITQQLVSTKKFFLLFIKDLHCICVMEGITYSELVKHPGPGHYPTYYMAIY